mmetsp:Transcript_102666/g.287730  ORF Transcript_102666/g.287730 Transcript_102666/m.287730 type:complete len:291 (-) Transcript_102666:125-997(-)
MSGAGDEELPRKIEEYRARERVYLAGLMEKEADMVRLRAMAADVLDAYGDRSRAAVNGALSFPTANMEVSVLRQKIRDRDQQIVELKEELEANRFDQHLPAGQALMRKCKALLTENRELGEEMSEERLSEVRSALQGEQRQNAQLYQKVNEASDFCKELSDENVKLQGTIARVAGMLRESRADLDRLVKERAEAKKKRKIEKGAKAMAAQMKASLGGDAEPPADAAEAPIFVGSPDAAAEVEMPADQPVSAASDAVPRLVPAEKKEKKKDKKEKSKKRKAEKITLEPNDD